MIEGICMDVLWWVMRRKQSDTCAIFRFDHSWGNKVGPEGGAQIKGHVVVNVRWILSCSVGHGLTCALS